MDVYARGIDISENGQAMEAFRTNPHGEHFLGNGHTLQNFETAFARSTEADNNSFEQWTDEGSLTSAQRANTTWKRMLAEYTGPGLDEAIDAELQDFIGRRKASMPTPTTRSGHDGNASLGNHRFHRPRQHGSAHVPQPRRCRLRRRRPDSGPSRWPRSSPPVAAPPPTSQPSLRRPTSC